MKKYKFISIIAIAVVLLLSSCTGEQTSQQDNQIPQPTENDISQQTNSNQADANIKGQIVTTQEIENKEGGYYIPIPDSWFNKVSYELDGTHTYIYHITRYKDELEINPVLLHINASNDVTTETPGVNIFLETDSMKYYEVLRFDAPYNQDSADDIEYISFYEDVPMILQSAWIMDGMDEVSSTTRGQVLNVRDLINETGGYTIPIPDSWFNKTSYEFDGTKTSIYHISHDQNEMTINPVILQIDVSDTIQDTMGINIFLEIGDKQYFEIPRFDFPYKDTTSPDGAEFVEFSEDIPMILQSTWVLDDSEWQSEMQNMQTGYFNKYDACVNGVSVMSANKEQTLSIFNDTPINIETTIWEATDELFESYEYDFGLINFIDGRLKYIGIVGGDYEGPRGIRLGDHVDDVMMKFSMSAEKSCDGYDIIYRANEGRDNEDCVPPCGTKDNYDDGSSSLYFCCFADDDDIADLSIEELEDVYLFIPTYNARFEFDSNGYLNSFTVYYDSGAE